MKRVMLMYDILIVDDEAVERQVIRFLLDKFGFPFRITEAANGQQALALLEKRRCHVLFTDIKMPFVDGLELAKQARELYPDLHIVFFSGFDDFEYARQALSLRIVNYILKPVNPVELQKTMAALVEQLRASEQTAKRENSLRGAVRRSALLQLLNGVRPERLAELYPQWDFAFLSGYHRMLLLQLDREQKPEALLPWETIGDLLPGDSQCLTLKPGSGLVLFSGKKHQTRWYRELEEKLRAAVGPNCHTELSHSFEDPGQIHGIYTQLKKTLRDRSYFRAGEEQQTPAPESDREAALLKQLGTDLQLKDAGGLRLHMEELLEACRKKHSRSGAQVRYLCTKVVTLLLDILPGDSVASFDEYARTISEERFPVVEEMLRELTEQAAAEFQAAGQVRSHAVLLAKQYIHSHYRDVLSLNIIAEKVHLSPRYLSALFMEEEGLGLNRYIKKVRMNKARERLLGTNMKVSEICEEVGYTNLSYFCKSFQDEFGMTPDKFRSLPKEGKGAGNDPKSL